MKSNLLAGTALVSATVLAAGIAAAADAPIYKVSGNMTFQFLNESQDAVSAVTTTLTAGGATSTWTSGSTPVFGPDHGYYFAVVDPEIRFTMTGTADNGLGYGFKVELNANATDTSVSDEVVAQFSGAWGRLELGDEDGAEDTMQLGAESVMGGSGGIDGSYGLVLNSSRFTVNTTGGYSHELSARTGPGIAGDTSDSTKITYYTPDFSGLSAGISFTPTQHEGDAVSSGGAWEDSIGLGVKYAGDFGSVAVAASAVYVTASAVPRPIGVEDVSAWSVGGKVGFGPAVIGASHADSGESLTPVGTGIKDNYWNVGLGYTSGPLYLSAGYAAYTLDVGVDWTRDVISLTADYAVAPGLTTYAEVVMSSEDSGNAFAFPNNDATVMILGAALSF